MKNTGRESSRTLQASNVRVNSSGSLVIDNAGQLPCEATPELLRDLEDFAKRFLELDENGEIVLGENGKPIFDKEAFATACEKFNIIVSDEHIAQIENIVINEEIPMTPEKVENEKVRNRAQSGPEK